MFDPMSINRESDVTVTFVVATVAEMSCALDVGFGDAILWNQVFTKHSFLPQIKSQMIETVVSK